MPVDVAGLAGLAGLARQAGPELGTSQPSLFTDITINISQFHQYKKIYICTNYAIKRIFFIYFHF